jgi:hypothetical protein
MDLASGGVSIMGDMWDFARRYGEEYARRERRSIRLYDSIRELMRV